MLKGSKGKKYLADGAYNEVRGNGTLQSVLVGDFSLSVSESPKKLRQWAESFPAQNGFGKGYP